MQLATKKIRPLQNRTDAKLRYARVHLDELIAHEPLGGDDFDRAHQESFLYHLLGARAAFLVELNEYYSTGLRVSSLTMGSLRNALKAQTKNSKELGELYALEKDSASWYCQAKDMRDHSTHHTGVKRAFHLGGSNDKKVFLAAPKTDQLIEYHFPLVFREWLNAMETLLTRLRASAVSTCNSSS